MFSSIEHELLAGFPVATATSAQGQLPPPLEQQPVPLPALVRLPLAPGQDESVRPLPSAALGLVAIPSDTDPHQWTSASQLNGLSLQLGQQAGVSTLQAAAGTAGEADGSPARRSFSLFSRPMAAQLGPSQGQASAALAPPSAPTTPNLWRVALDFAAVGAHGPAGSGARATAETSADDDMGAQQALPGSQAGQGPLNEVVCGALMLAYERAGKWQEAVAVLLRAAKLGIAPNTVMYNTAISAAGKAGQLGVAERLYAKVRQPDAVTHETMLAAYGMAGHPVAAEAVFGAMLAGGMRPRDFAYCGLIAAHSLAGDWDEALRVRQRMRRAGVQPSVHSYNALLAACERAAQPHTALELLAAMRAEGVEANALTAQLLQLIGRQGVRSIEETQQLAAVWSAALAACGGLLMHTGVF